MIRSVDINARFLTQPITGVQRFAVEMVRGIDRHLSVSVQLRSQFRFRLVAPPSARAIELEHIPLVRAGRLSGHGWEQLELPRQAKSGLLLNLCNTAPVLARNVVVIHDAAVFAVPDAYSRAFRLWYRALIPTLARRAVRVLTVSEFSRTELLERVGIPRGRVDVVTQGCEHIRSTPADPRVFSRLQVTRGEYLLAVGSRTPHKNIGLLAAAIAQLGGAAPPLVIAGGSNSRIFGAATGVHREGVHDAGYVTDSELRALYEGACCFIYPSLYEGFGIPPLEAMVCGCPVIVARAAALPEVCGDAARYCDPRDAGDLARQIRLLIQQPAVRQELRQRGFERAALFSWQKASAGLLETLGRVHPA